MGLSACIPIAGSVVHGPRIVSPEQKLRTAKAGISMGFGLWGQERI